MNRPHNPRRGWLLVIAIWLLPREVAAYIDPGTTGMLSQVLYVLFYAVLGVLFYFLKYIKSLILRAKSFVVALIRR